MTRYLALAALLLAAACARPLTPSETLVAKNLFGDTLDTEAVSIKAGIGMLPLPRDRAREGSGVVVMEAPPDLCVRRRSTQRYWSWPAAFVLENDVYFSYRFYAADAFRGFPDSAPYPASILLAHELVHVWQWQNRARTAYTTEGAAGETIAHVDPYWFEARRDAEFFALGYEQQGALVQDFVCYALFDRDDPKLDDLASVLRPVLPVDDFLAMLR
ncbi:hypothetical protein [Sinisalibacter aestuarii]|uniref:DUF4157 domain-containing protein n=1 Tax=Sinisalibacter aestuarii TaxID=2949426 RepID=A0ABQ5LTF3_9RHOB|nr:hypothetical protein [Sinisalibacter aestuarii]GKY88264.1 hypothetical protein STA1M1_21330 [Sinisalibacter aestuarii]